MVKKANKKVAPVDTETTDTGEVIGTENDKRLAMYNQIADNNDKERSEEFYEVDEDGQTVEGLNLESEDEEVEELEGAPEGSDQDDEEEEDDREEEIDPPEQKATPPGLTGDQPKYKITVNGVQKEVSVEDLIATAQKVESADDYLREASRLNQEARQLKNPTQQEETPVEEVDEVALARAIQMGSEEEAVAAIRKLRSTGPSSDDLARTIDERLNFQSSVAWFQSEYKDICSDPLLAQLAINQDNILRQKGDKRSYVERYKEIGDGIRGWVASKAPQPEVKETPEPEVKVETPTGKKQRKAAAPSVPKPAGVKVSAPEEDDEEESVSDTIANMAKSRGGPQWLRS